MDNSYTSNAFLFGFAGRINRARYWYALFASLTFCAVVLGLLALALGAAFGVHVSSVNVDFDGVFTDPLSWPFRADFGDTSPAATRTLTSILFAVGGAPVFIVAMWIVAATTLKRLHDRDRSGWWIVPFVVAPRLADRVETWLGTSVPVAILMLALAALGVWGFVELFVLRGTSGENRFGADPLAPTDPGPPAAARWDQHSELDPVPSRAHPSRSACR